MNTKYNGFTSSEKITFTITAIKDALEKKIVEWKVTNVSTIGFYKSSPNAKIPPHAKLKWNNTVVRYYLTGSDVIEFADIDLDFINKLNQTNQLIQNTPLKIIFKERSTKFIVRLPNVKRISYSREKNFDEFLKKVNQLLSEALNQQLSAA